MQHLYLMKRFQRNNQSLRQKYRTKMKAKIKNRLLLHKNQNVPLPNGLAQRKVSDGNIIS